MRWPAGARLRLLPSVAVVALACFLDLSLWGGHTDYRRGNAPVAAVYVSAVPVFALLLLRRQWPRAVYAAAWIYGVGWAIMLPEYQPFLALLVALHGVARYCTLTHGWPFLAAAAVPFGLNTYNYAIGRALDGSVAFVALVWASLSGVAWLIGRYGFTSERQTVMREAQLLSERSLAVAQERIRLAAELHDTIAHAVTVILFQAAGVNQSPQGPENATRRALRGIETAATSAMRELRELLAVLHEEGDPPPADRPLSRLPELVATTKSCGIDATVREAGNRVDVPEATEHAIFRLVQEALSNVLKHGGRGAAVQVTLDWTGVALAVRVESYEPATSTPATFDPSGFGLAGLRARVEAAGGSSTAGWSDPKHFRVSATFPLPQRSPPVLGGSSNA